MIDTEQYRRLLSQALPAPVASEKDAARLMALVEQLHSKEELTAEEEVLQKLLVILIEEYEDRTFPVEESTPRDALLVLMQEHGLRQADLLEVFGSRGITSEVISGKRSISKAQAKKLSERFHVGVEVFI